MNKLTIVPLLAGVAVTGVLVAGALSFAAGAPSTAATVAAAASKAHAAVHKHHHRAAHHATIASVTGTTLTLTSHKHSLTLNISEIAVRAGAYSATPALLAAGEHVIVLGAKTSHPQVILLPVAHGILTASSGGWTVVNPHVTLTLSGPSPTLLGMSALTSGTHVSVYGTRSATTVTANAVAANPAKLAGTVLSNQNGTLTVKTKTNPGLTITEAHVSGTKTLAKIKTGRHVLVIINPATQAPLAVIPRPRHHKAVMGRWAVGTFVSESTQSLNMKNSLGSESVPLAGRTVKVIWPQHTGASLSQIPAGTHLAVHLAGKNTLIVRVS